MDSPPEEQDIDRSRKRSKSKPPPWTAADNMLLLDFYRKNKKAIDQNGAAAVLLPENLIQALEKHSKQAIIAKLRHLRESKLITQAKHVGEFILI
jgi:hypothetical protein